MRREKLSEKRPAAGRRKILSAAGLDTSFEIRALHQPHLNICSCNSVQVFRQVKFKKLSEKGLQIYTDEFLERRKRFFLLDLQNGAYLLLVGGRLEGSDSSRLEVGIGSCLFVCKVVCLFVCLNIDKQHKGEQPVLSLQL